MATSLVPPRRLVARRRPTTAAAAVAVLAVLLLAVPACSVLRGAVSTIRALDKAGFGSSKVEPGDGTDTWVVNVEKDTEDLDAAAVEAAGVVWRNLPLRIARLQVTCGNGFGGKGTFFADRAELERRFGAREPDLDKGFEENDVRTVAIVVALLVVGGVLVLGGIVLMVVVLIRRNRKRKQPPGPWGPGGPPARGGEVSQPPPPGYGPQP